MHICTLHVHTHPTDLSLSDRNPPRQRLLSFKDNHCKITIFKSKEEQPIVYLCVFLDLHHSLINKLVSTNREKRRQQSRWAYHQYQRKRIFQCQHIFFRDPVYMPLCSQNWKFLLWELSPVIFFFFASSKNAWETNLKTVYTYDNVTVWHETKPKTRPIF